MTEKTARRSTRTLGAMAFIVFVACTATSEPTSAARPIASPRTSIPASKRDAEAAAEVLLDRVVTPPGAEETSVPAVEGVRNAAMTPISPFVATKSRWWTVRMQHGLAKLWFEDHPPRGMKKRAESGSDVPIVVFEPLDKSGLFPNVQLSFAKVSDDEDAVGATAVVIWTPARAVALSDGGE